MDRYKSLAEMLAAAEAGGRKVHAMLDNDAVYFSFAGDSECETELELHPYALQQQALALLGITAESV